jgi:hypothetical protein
MVSRSKIAKARKWKCQSNQFSWHITEFAGVRIWPRPEPNLGFRYKNLRVWENRVVSTKCSSDMIDMQMRHQDRTDLFSFHLQLRKMMKQQTVRSIRLFATLPCRLE